MALCAAITTGLVLAVAGPEAKAVEWPMYNALARQACNTPIRPGEPGVRPFWNGKATMYKHAPAFGLDDVAGAKSYGFRLTSADGSKPLTWKADHPWRPVPADVWALTPLGRHELEVTALDGGGKVIANVAKLEFVRQSCFNGPFPESNSTHAWTAERVFAHVANIPHVKEWLETGEPSKSYGLYCYPAKILGAMIRALVRYPSRDAENAARAKAIACKMADWLIAHSQPADAPLAHFPPTYWGDARDVAVRYAGQNMLIYPAAAGHAFLELFEATGEAKYRDAAVGIARTYLKLQGADGTWPLKLYEKDGSEVVPNRLIPGRVELDFLEAVAKATGDKAFQAAADRAFQYVLDGPCRTWNWQAQFEDMPPLPPYENLQHGVAGETAVRLFGLGKVDLACEITDWCEDQFVVWDDTQPTDNGSCLTPCVFEQYGYYTPIDASIAGMVRTFSAAWQATGDELYYQKAKALADSLSRQQRRNGEIPTYFKSGKHREYWVNCMVYAAIVLEDFAKAEEKMGRTVRPERIMLWPEGKMPNPQANQPRAPYVDWYSPAVKTTKLVLIHCSGGGYKGSGTDGFEVNPVREYFLARGVNVVTLRYRAPRPVGLPKHLTAWQDAQRAIRIVRSEAAKRGCDPECIGFLGCSAGGHLTLMAALSSTVSAYPRVDELDDLPCHVNFAVPVYPAYALEPEMEKADVAGCDDLSCGFPPEFAFDAKTPPMCFVHGDDDVWSPMASVRVYNRLRTMKVPCEMHIMAKEGHCFMEHPLPGFPAANWKDRVWEWLFRTRLLKCGSVVGHAAVAAPTGACGRLVRAEGFDTPPAWATVERPGVEASPRDRGRRHVPVALLVPAAAGEDVRADDKSVFGGCLADPSFGELCAVLRPDAGLDHVKFSQALFDYKAAFLVGEFDNERFDKSAIADYVRYGGTLVCFRDQVEAGLVDPGLVCQNAAKPWLTDEKGAVLAWMSDCGKGRIVSVAGPGAVADGGACCMPVVRKLLEACRDELMPFAVKVAGDVHWGVNRTHESWLLWAEGGAAAGRVKAVFGPTGAGYEMSVPADGKAVVEVPIGPAKAPEGFKLGYQMDVSRDKIPQMEGLRRIVGMLGRLGYNQFQMYFKNAFAYKAHPEMQEGVSPITAAEVREIDADCAARGIDLIPYQNIFGHLEPWLRHPKYAHLAELPQNPTTLKKADVAKFAHKPESWFSDIEGYQSGSLCATSPESLKFATGLLDELLPNFRSKYVNTGCDEVWDLASDTARSRTKVLEVGSARVYLDYLNEIERLVRARGRTMMFWGDIILRSPELVKELPEDAVCLNWGYSENHPYDRECPVFRKSGRRFYTCPSTAACGNLFGDVFRMKRNVDNAFANGVANGAEGMLLTDWGDYGNPQPWITSVPGLVYSAARMRGERLSDAELARRIDALLGCDCGAAILRYGYAARAARLPSDIAFCILQKQGKWDRPDGLRDADVEAYLAELKAAKALFDPSGAPGWIRGEFRLLDLLARAVEASWRGELAAKRDGLVNEYRETWTINNRPGGLDDSVRQVFFGELHN